MPREDNGPDSRPRDPDFEARVKAEAARLQEILDERQRLKEQERMRSLKDSEDRVRQTILQDIERIEIGSLSAHCRTCLEGYAAARLREGSAELGRFCQAGKELLLARTPGLDLSQVFALMAHYR